LHYPVKFLDLGMKRFYARGSEVQGSEVQRFRGSGFRGSGFKGSGGQRFKGSRLARPPAAEAVSLIEKESLG
jgi:hypothetical protein